MNQNPKKISHPCALKCLGARVHQNPLWQSFNIAKNLHEKKETNKTLNPKLGHAYIYMHILTLKTLY